MSSTPIGPDPDPEIPPDVEKDREKATPSEKQTQKAADSIFQKASSQFRQVKKKFFASKEKIPHEQMKAQLIELNSDCGKAWDFFEAYLALSDKGRKISENLDQLAFFSLFLKTQKDEIYQLFPKEMRKLSESFLKNAEFEKSFNRYLKKNYELYMPFYEDGFKPIMEKAGEEWNADRVKALEVEAGRGKDTHFYLEVDQELKKYESSKNGIQTILQELSSKGSLRDEFFKKIVRLLLSHDAKAMIGSGIQSLAPPGEVFLLQSDNPHKIQIKIKDLKENGIRFIYMHRSGIVPRLGGDEAKSPIAHLNFQYICDLKYQDEKWNLELKMSPPYVTL